MRLVAALDLVHLEWVEGEHSIGGFRARTPFGPMSNPSIHSMHIRASINMPLAFKLENTTWGLERENATRAKQQFGIQACSRHSGKSATLTCVAQA